MKNFPLMPYMRRFPDKAIDQKQAVKQWRKLVNDKRHSKQRKIGEAMEWFLNQKRQPR